MITLLDATNYRQMFWYERQIFLWTQTSKFYWSFCMRAKAKSTSFTPVSSFQISNSKGQPLRTMDSNFRSCISCRSLATHWYHFFVSWLGLVLGWEILRRGLEKAFLRQKKCTAQSCTHLFCWKKFIQSVIFWSKKKILISASSSPKLLHSSQHREYYRNALPIEVLRAKN